MFLTTFFMIFGLIGFHYRAHMYRACLRLILLIIRFYLVIIDNTLFFLPTFIFSKTHTHKTIDSDFSVHEYYYNHKGRFYKCKFIESKDYDDINSYFNNLDVNKWNKVNHICIMNTDGEYIKDITADIRHFIHMEDIIEWKYILIHLGIEHEHMLLIHKNDDELSEMCLNIIDIYDTKFTI